MSDRLFDVEDFPEVPLFRPPRRRRGAQIEDERLEHDYPPEWRRCPGCDGGGYRFDPGTFQFAVGVDADDPKLVKVVLTHEPTGEWTYGAGRSEIAAKSHIRIAQFLRKHAPCPDCLGMGSLKARVRLEAGHRCVRCGHPYMPKGDARMLGVEPSPHQWSPCDRRCTHESGPFRVPTWREPERTFADWLELAGVLMFEGAWDDEPYDEDGPPRTGDESWGHLVSTQRVEAEWRILTVHHLDGDKANLRWWNLASLCQRCHLTIQAKVVLERVYPHEHSDWFKPYAAGYYAWVYEGREVTREEAEARMDELLASELAAG